MRILGIVLIVSGLGLIGLYVLAQRKGVRLGRRRVRFDRALDLTTPVTVAPPRAPFVLAPDDRGVLTRVVGVLWILLMIVFLSALTAALIWMVGSFITNAITRWGETVF